MTRERTVRIPSRFSIAVGITILISAVACVSGNVNALLLVLLRVPDLLIVALWLVASFGWGSAGLKFSKAWRSVHWPLFAVTSIALGLGLMSLAVLGFGLIGRLNGKVGWTILLTGVAIGLRNVFASSIGEQREGTSESGVTTFVGNRPLPGPLPIYRESEPVQYLRWFWLLQIAVGTVAMICALLPPGLLWGDEPNGYDIVEYHLQVPREWFDAGRIIPLTHNVFSYFPFNVEMHYLLAMHLRGGPWAGMYVAQLMHVAFVAMAALGVYAVIAERSKRAAVVITSMVACTPWMGLLAPVAYNEGGLLLWGTLAIALLMRGRRFAMFAGVMAGFACGAKLTAVPTVLIAAPLAGLIARQISFRAVTVFWLAGIVTFSPWLIRNYRWTANPVFPEMTSIFGRAHWDQVQVERWQKANHEPRVDQQNLSGKLAALRDQIVDDWRYAFLPMVLALVAAIISWRERQMRMLAVLLIGLAVFWTFFTHLQSRFFVLAIPLAGLMIGESADRKLGRFTVACTLAAIIGVTALFWKVWSLDPRIFGLIGVSKLDGLTVLSENNLPNDYFLWLIGEARAFNYSQASKLNYRTVFDVKVGAGQSLIDAWTREFKSGGSETVRLIDPNELRRFAGTDEKAGTYWGLPKPDAATLQMPGPTVVREQH